MVPLVVVVVVVDGTFCMMVVVVRVIVMICTWSLLAKFIFLPGLPSKAMSNRVQNLHLSGVLLPY